MKTVLTTLAVWVAAASMLHAESKDYSGSLAGAGVTASLNWVDEKNLIGVVTLSSDQSKKMTLSGQNIAAGQLRVFVAIGADHIGTAKLTKTTTASSIIWSGPVLAPDGSSLGVLELQRAR